MVNERAQRHAHRAAQPRQHHRLDQELHLGCRSAARPSDFADADLVRPLGDAHQHDVHDHDPAHHQRDQVTGTTTAEIMPSNWSMNDWIASGVRVSKWSGCPGRA